MEDIMSKIWEMTLYGSIAIVMVIIFRAVFHKIPKKITCLFWIAVAVRLLCPFNFSMGFGIANLFEREQTQAVTDLPVVAGETDNVIVNAPEAVQDKAVESPVHKETSAAVMHEMKLPEIALIVWSAGIALSLGVLTFQNVRIRRLIKEGRREDDIIVSDKVSTPFVAGIYKPVIVLPSLIDRSEREYLICHEKVHIKNKDNLARALGLIIVCIHWFNPLVWIAYKLMCNDLEMRVDEEVIDTIGNEIKKDYCMSIVNHAMAGSRYKVYGASFAKKTLSGMEVKMRINNLIKYKKVSNIAATLIVVASLGSTMVLSSCANETAAETTPAPTSEKESAVVEETAAESTAEVVETEVDDEAEETTETSEETLRYGYKFNPTANFSDSDDYSPTLYTIGSDASKSEYCADFGERKVLDMEVRDFKEVCAEISVTPDYYEGTDFYDLAKAYSDDGYALFDIGKTYEVWGGCFFKEGFLACTSAFTIAVVRTDVDTMNAFLKGDYNGMVQLESYENELTDNGDGTSTLSADMTLIQAYAEGEPVYVTNHADAVMYDQTSIAVVQMLWPWA